MKKIVMAMLMVLSVAGWNGTVYCQEESNDDFAVEQSESQVSSDLSSEISSDRAQGEAEVDQEDSAMNISGN